MLSWTKGFVDSKLCVAEYSIVYIFVSALCCLHNESHVQLFSDSPSYKIKQDVKTHQCNKTANILLGTCVSILVCVCVYTYVSMYVYMHVL